MNTLAELSMANMVKGGGVMQVGRGRTDTIDKEKGETTCMRGRK